MKFLRNILMCILFLGNYTYSAINNKDEQINTLKFNMVDLYRNPKNQNDLNEVISALKKLNNSTELATWIKEKPILDEGFDAETLKSQEITLKDFIDKVIIESKQFQLLANINFDRLIYETFKNESWLKKSDPYPFLETLNLLKHAQISKDDAIKFLKFGKETSEDSENLKTLRKGYEFAKKYKLKEAGKLILDHLQKLASLHKDVGNIIMSYEAKE